jgi:ATP-binding cassette subfamily C (CFTR/MRP) protein 1
VALQLTLLILWTSSSLLTSASIPAAVLSLLVAIAILTLSYIEHIRAIRPSFLLNIYLSCAILSDMVQIRTLYLRDHGSLIASVQVAGLAVKIILLILEAQTKRSYLKLPYSDYPPEAISGIFNRTFFVWINPMFMIGFQKILALEDLYSVDKHLLSEHLRQVIQISWRKYQSSKRHALIRASIHCLRGPLAATVFPPLCLIGFNYAQPFLIGTIITYVGKVDRNENYGYGLIAATGLVYLGIAVSTVHYQHCLFRMITMFRGAMVSLIYARTLELQAAVLDDSASLTLMSTDIDRVVFSLEQAMELWARSIEIAIGIWLLERQLGWVCIAPIVVVMISVVSSAQVARFIGDTQKEWVQSVQQRVAVTASMLSSMKVVKMMGLSNFLFSTVQDYRVRELERMKRFRVFMIWRSGISMLPALFGPLSAFAIFAIITAVNGSSQLSIVQAFTSLAILSLLTNPAQALLGSLPQVAMAVGCFDRIQAFLLERSFEDRREAPRDCRFPGEEKMNAVATAYFSNLDDSSRCAYAVEIENASVKPSHDAPVAIQAITMKAKKGSISFVVGPVGCGKSTLLKALLGELPPSVGIVRITTRHIAYCSQAIWLQNTTIRNIICGNKVSLKEDEAWYNTVVHAAALDEDIRELPNGHATVIGSRGITLSGGQKQRLALARTIYAKADIVLLDDILSALDASTREQIVQRLFGEEGVFRRLNSTVILATNATQYLSRADQIVILDSTGHITDQGTFDNLKARRRLSDSILWSKIGDKSGKEPEVVRKPLAKAAASVKGPTANDFADLTRQTGDVSVYKYYLASISWLWIFLIVFMMSCYTFMTKFQRKFNCFWSPYSVC